jgi:hypothetical protein
VEGVKVGECGVVALLGPGDDLLLRAKVDGHRGGWFWCRRNCVLVGHSNSCLVWQPRAGGCETAWPLGRVAEQGSASVAILSRVRLALSERLVLPLWIALSRRKNGLPGRRPDC